MNDTQHRDRADSVANEDVMFISDETGNDIVVIPIMRFLKNRITSARIKLEEGDLWRSKRVSAETGVGEGGNTYGRVDRSNNVARV